MLPRRPIPLHSCTYKPLNTVTPLLSKRNFLFEKLHIQHNTDDYYTELNSIIEQLYKALHSSKRFIFYTNNPSVKYVKAVIDKKLFITKIVIYLAIDNTIDSDGHDAVTYAYDASHEPIVDSEQPVAIVMDNKLIKASIVISLGIDLYNDYRLFKDRMFEIIGHELMHAFHETTGVNLNKLAGDAYYYAHELCSAHNISFNIDYGSLCQISQQTAYSNDAIILMYSALMYYCDPSEMSAFMLTAHNESKNMVEYSFHAPLGSSPKTPQLLINTYKVIKTYRLYTILYDFLKEYKRDLIKIQKNHIYPFNRYILLEYSLNIKASIASLPNTWLHKLDTFLNNIKTVHINNVIEKFKSKNKKED